MKLSRVAKRFNDTPCVDAYTGEFLFHAQLGVFTEAVRDGITTQRRVLELAPELEVPERRTITFGDVTWILGGKNIDTFRGKVIRKKYPIQESQGIAHVRSPLEELEQDEGLIAHAGIVFVKTNKEVEISSGEYNYLTMYFSRSESVFSGQIIEQENEKYIVKEVYPATAGHLGVIVEKLDVPTLTVAETEGKRDPVTEMYLPGAEIPICVLRWQTDYQYYSLATETFKRGDVQSFVQPDAPASTGSRITIEGQKYLVVSHDLRNGVKYLHLRRDV